MASHRQEQEEHPDLNPRPGSTILPAAQYCLLVPLQALSDLKTLGCRKAMRKFDKHTLLVSGVSVSLSETRSGRVPWTLVLESEGRNPGPRADTASLPDHGAGHAPSLGFSFLICHKRRGT